MRWPMACYLAGLFLCGLTFIPSYLTQFFLYNEEIGDFRAGRHKIFLWIAVLFAVGSLTVFAVGSYRAAVDFQSMKAPLCEGGI